MKNTLKRLFLYASVVIIAAACLAFSAQAEKWDNYEYVILDNGTVEITDYEGTVPVLYVPSEIEGKKVTSVADRAFDGCPELDEIHLPVSLEHMGDTFYECSGLVVYYMGDIYQWMKVEGWENVSDYFNVITEPHVHTEITIKGKEATCTEEGLSDGKLCTSCSVITEKQIVISPKGHRYANSCDKSCNVCGATRTVSHTYKTVATKATLTKNGRTETKCSVCDKVKSTTAIYCPKTIKLSATSYTYNGKVQKPSVTVKDSKGNTLKKDTDYTVKYESGCKATGKYTVTVTFKGNYSGTKKLTFTIAPKATGKLTASQSTSAIKLTWKKVTGADGYRVYQYNSKTKKYEKLKDVTGTSLKVSKLKAGTTYKFKVRAYKKDDGTVWGDYSAVFATATKPAAPKITKLTTSKAKASLTWSNVSGESGYEVYVSTKKNSGFKKVITTKADILKGSKSKLKSGKKYYFKVRAYKTVDGEKIYSAWSAVKSIKIK